MDEYLKPNAAYERLLREYNKHGRLVAGYDFDSTVFDSHGTGGSYEMVRQLIRDLKGIGCTVICWTANENLEFVKDFLIENNIPCDGINIDAKHPDSTSRKAHFDCLLDDRSGLLCAYHDLSRLVREVKRLG